MSELKNNARFLSIAQFKTEVQVDKLEVKYNPTSKKHFCVSPDGRTWKSQGTIDQDKPMQFIADESDIELKEACLINYDDTKGAQTKFSL